MCREPNSFTNIQGGNENYDPWEIYNFPALEPSAPQQPQDDELVQENEHLDDGPNLPVENPDEFLFPEQFIDAPPIPPVEQDDNTGQAPNEDPNDISSSGGHPPIEIPSLSEYEENDRIQSRIQILNISLFVLEAINIIFNQITYIQPQE